MTLSNETLITIIGMALVTYATRAGGVWLMGRVTLSGWVERWLKQVPGTVLVAIVAPTVLTGGIAQAIAAVATVLVAVRTKSLLFAMVAGVIVVWLLRLF